MTVAGLMTLLENDYGVELSMLSSGVTILYSDFMDRKKMAVRGCFVLPFCFCVFLWDFIENLAQSSVYIRCSLAYEISLFNRALVIISLVPGPQGDDTQGCRGKRNEEGTNMNLSRVCISPPFL